MRVKNKQQRDIETGNPSEVSAPNWETFFYCQRSPVLRSQLLLCLMAGTPITVSTLPKAALLDALLLAFTTRMYCSAEIVDSFDELCARVEEEWSKPDWTTKVFSSMHANAANWVLKGTTAFACSEEQYIPKMVNWYLNQNPPEVFDRVATEEDVRKAMLQQKRPPTKAKKAA